MPHKLQPFAKCPICQQADWQLVFRYKATPPGETTFVLPKHKSYRRRVDRCRSCGHYVSTFNQSLTAFYRHAYVNGTYGSAEGMKRAFDRITHLPRSRSDNSGRVKRIVESLGNKGWVLDVGAGLGVFPHAIKQAGWNVVALDPDPRACEHIRQVVGVPVIEADFTKARIRQKFDLITFNKVLEHVSHPIAMLAKAKPLLKQGGRVYIELPDGEVAAEFGPGREEFFVEHLHVWSAASFALLIQKADFRVGVLDRLHEPSDKFTLYAFANKGR